MSSGWFDNLMNWFVAPLFGAVLWLLARLRHLSTQDHVLRHEIALEIAGLRAELRVLETRQEAQAAYSKTSHEALHAQVSAVMNKLDGIEAHLRRRDTR